MILITNLLLCKVNRHNSILSKHNTHFKSTILHIFEEGIHHCFIFLKVVLSYLRPLYFLEKILLKLNFFNLLIDLLEILYRNKNAPVEI